MLEEQKFESVAKADFMMDHRAISIKEKTYENMELDIKNDESFTF